MVDSIHGRKGPGPLEPLKRAQKADEAGKAKKGAGAADFAAELKNADRTAQGPAKTAAGAPQAPITGVQFSPVLHDLDKVRDAMDVERAAKVQSLKQQVAEGNYQPDLKKVAASLLYFVAKGK